MKTPGRSGFVGLLSYAELCPWRGGLGQARAERLMGRLLAGDLRPWLCTLHLEHLCEGCAAALLLEAVTEVPTGVCGPLSAEASPCQLLPLSPRTPGGWGHFSRPAASLNLFEVSHFIFNKTHASCALSFVMSGHLLWA